MQPSLHFQGAPQRICILFLDEFDAIAKARDDVNELGELKRVVNTLLQNIDQFTDNNILIAATNHHQLLDRAVWRRFSQVIYIGLPDIENRIELIRIYIGTYLNDFIEDDKRIINLAHLLDNKSPSDIKSLCSATIKNNIVKGKKLIEYPEILYEIYKTTKYTEYNLENLVKFLSENGATQAAITQLLNLSIRNVRSILAEK